MKAANRTVKTLVITTHGCGELHSLKAMITFLSFASSTQCAQVCGDAPAIEAVEPTGATTFSSRRLLLLTMMMMITSEMVNRQKKLFLCFLFVNFSPTYFFP